MKFLYEIPYTRFYDFQSEMSVIKYDNFIIVFLLGKDLFKHAFIQILYLINTDIELQRI